ncbi:MAG TPA: transposase [Patescibacteria group bacterium]
MAKPFLFSDFLKLFPSDNACLSEIKKLRYPKGIPCKMCNKITKHYKITGRNAYSCENCRHQVYPLSGTIFEKTTTPLRIWFICMYLMTQTRTKISIRQLQQELGVTYKTSWKMYHDIKNLMKQNNSDLLAESEEVIKWTLFGAFEFKVVQRQDSSE